MVIGDVFGLRTFVAGVMDDCYDPFEPQPMYKYSNLREERLVLNIFWVEDTYIWSTNFRV